MNINGEYYHPTFLYESIWNLIGLIILLIIYKHKKENGMTTSFYLVWYGIGRFLIESLRQDSLMLSNIKIAQLVSVIMIILGVIIFLRQKKKTIK